MAITINQCRSRSTNGLLALVLGALCVGSSCSSGADDPTPELSLDAYDLLTAEPNAVGSALLDRELRFQEAVAECMSDDGFEYYPADDSEEEAIAAELRPPGTVPGLVPSNWAAEHGFGLAGAILRSIDQPPFQADVDDRNERYLSSLSQADLNAYAETLGSCETSSGEAVGFDELEVQMDRAQVAAEEVETRLEADPIVYDLQAEWSECYVAAGGWFADDAEAPTDPAALYEQMAEEVFGGDGEESAPDRSRYEDLFELERSAAVTSARCAEEVDFERRFIEIRNRYIEQELEG